MRTTTYMPGETVWRFDMALAPGDVAIPEEIPTYLAGYKNATYRFDEVSKPVPVDKTEDQYRTFSEDDAYERINIKASFQQKVPEVDVSSSLASYKTQLYLIGSFVADRTESNAKGKPRMHMQHKHPRVCRYWNTSQTIGEPCA